ncbi:MAG: 2-C-methyl-D-erythritol 2,4-cyclodiphosphate synthase [Oscillospiraceae bacterium]|nr:2-C-methyl-D-erythritol 2,4-cyclodiphosphate synthase [Oscillospiraceae bacterium]
MKIGHGYDVHRLVEDRKFILGGVIIPYSMGLLGHSDADVVIHAVIDSLLGAAGMGDIGCLFPDTDKKYKDISSRELLKYVYKLLIDSNYSIGNIDITIIIQKPYLKPYVDLMKKNISEDLNMEIGYLNIKATTEEKLGFTGREEGVSCHAVCILNIDK